MKVGFTIAQNQGLESKIYGHFGSAPMFMVVDTESKQVSCVNNAHDHHVHGACNPITALSGNKIDIMVVAGIGPGAINKLNAMGIKVYRAAAATINENLDLLAQNRLRELSMEDSCREHAGSCSH